MRHKKRAYNTFRSLLYGGISIVVYALVIIRGIYFAWGQTMQNGEPGILTMAQAEQLTTTALYRINVFGWCIAFGLLALLLFIPFWLISKSRQDIGTIRNCARYERHLSTALFLAVYVSYVRHHFEFAPFAYLNINLILVIVQGAISVYVFIKALRNPFLHAFHKQRTTSTEPNDSDLTLFERIRTAIWILVQVFPFIDFLLNFPFVSQAVYRFFSWLYVPQPFVLRTPYDWIVMAMPLLALTLMLLNMRYNAPVIVGDVLEYTAQPRKGFSTLVRIVH